MRVTCGKGPAPQPVLPAPAAATGQPLSLRDPGEDAPRPPLPGKSALRAAAAPGGRGSPAAGTAPAVRGKAPYSPPPQESAMLGRPPSPRCPRSRRPRRRFAFRGLREKGPAAPPQRSARCPASAPAPSPLARSAGRHVSAAAVDPPPAGAAAFPGAGVPLPALGPRTAAPHRPARRGTGGAPALTHSAALHLPPPVAAGLAPRRRAEKGQQEEPAPSPNLPGSHHHGTARRVPLRPFRAPRPPLPVPPSTAPSPRPRAGGSRYRSRPPPVTTDAPARSGARGGRRRCSPPSIPLATSPAGGESPRTPAPVLT